VPERDIRRELKKRVESYGGEIRAVAWLGRRNAPDVLCLFPLLDEEGWHCYVETKAPGGKPTAAQQREHERLALANVLLIVISTIEQLNNWLPPRA